MLHAFSEENIQHIRALIHLALMEDHAGEDITSRAIFDASHITTMQITAREPMVFAGETVVPLLLDVASAEIIIQLHVRDGDIFAAGARIATISGSTIAVLALERTMLNLLQRMCGVATLTNEFVKLVEGTKAKILDTRKTIAGWRALDKYAVVCGGGMNHRMHLADMVMIKDNHIAAAGGIAQAVERVVHLQQQGIQIEVECDTLEQLNVCMELPVDRILLDNMSLSELKQAVDMVAGRIPLEASGGVNLQTVRAIAQTGVDFISVGQLTHSAVAVDIGLDEVPHNTKATK